MTDEGYMVVMDPDLKADLQAEIGAIRHTLEKQHDSCVEAGRHVSGCIYEDKSRAELDAVVFQFPDLVET